MSQDDFPPTDDDDPYVDISGQRKPRIGSVLGAGPKEAWMTRREELPDDPEALKGKYLELQKTLQDLRTIQHHNQQQQRFLERDTVNLSQLIKQAGSVTALALTYLSLIGLGIANTTVTIPLASQIGAAGALAIVSEKMDVPQLLGNIYRKMVSWYKDK